MNHILLVDDHDDLRRLLENSLRQQGYAVTSASSGQAAFDLASIGSFDVVLSDVEMMDGDGYWLLAELQRAGFNTPVILMSGKSELSMSKARDLGAHGFVPKPFLDQDIFNAVEAAVFSRRVKPAAKGSSLP